MVKKTLIKNMDRLCGLYAITDARVTDPQQLLADVEQALRGGARIVQYRDKSRDKNSHHTQRHETCQALHALTREFNALFIINDDVELAKQCHADGVHLGKNDITISTARDILGPNVNNNAIIGVSCYNRIELAQQAVNNGADYIAFGRFFASQTKPDAVPASLDLLKQARQLFELPIVAIGGITADNGGALIAAGAHMLAAVDDIFGHAGKANAIEAAARRYQALFMADSDC